MKDVKMGVTVKFDKESISKLKDIINKIQELKDLINNINLVVDIKCDVENEDPEQKYENVINIDCNSFCMMIKDELNKVSQ